MKTILIAICFCAAAVAQPSGGGVFPPPTKDVAPRQLVTVAFASLGTPANGTILYCSDCTAANPCAGSGSGATARRENGVWNCTGSSGGSGNVTAGGTLTANLPVIGSGTTAVAVGTRSGNTTEFATVTGTKTVDKQLKFDASGNVTASATDIGAGGGGGGSAAWGAITGTLSDQTDLNSALAAKAPAANPTFSGTVTTPITGSTQCVQVNTSGVLSGTGSACGAGGGTTYAAGPSGLVVIDTAPSPDTIDLDTALICTKAGTCAPTGLQDFSGAAGVIIKEGTPVNSSATCTKGMVLYDAFYTYFCVATNSWKRLTLETF